MDGDKDLLERSMIVFGSPMGDSNLHNQQALPAHRVGHANDSSPATCISRRRTARRWRTRFLTLLHKLGVDDVKSFGAARRVRTQRLIEPQLRGEESLMTVHSKMSCKMLGALAAVALPRFGE